MPYLQLTLPNSFPTSLQLIELFILGCILGVFTYRTAQNRTHERFLLHPQGLFKEKFSIYDILSPISLGAALAWVFWLKPPEIALIYSLSFCLLWFACAVDASCFILPDRSTIGLIVLGTIGSVLVPQLHGVMTWQEGLIKSLLGSLSGLLLMGSLLGLGFLLLRKQGVGIGDIKLMVGFGALFGYQAPFFILTAAAFIGLGVSVWKKLSRGDMLPLGPCLCASALLWIAGGYYPTANFFQAFFRIFQ